MSDASQQNALICPHCLKENEPGAQKCAHCGTPLIITVPVPESPAEQPVVTRPALGALPAEGVAPGTIVLSIAGYPQPVKIEGRREIILGRYTPGETLPVVDLTRYNAHLLGVSRRHATLTVTEDRCTIEDMNSANGTWVNENRLVPNKPYTLRGGDQVRLGHLFMFVSFSAMDSIFLTDATGSLAAQHRLTPLELVTRISPYLKALDDIQQVVSEMHGRKPLEVSISALSVSGESSIHVKLERATEAIRLVQEHVTPWMHRHSRLIEQVHGPEQPAAASPAAADPSRTTALAELASQLSGAPEPPETVVIGEPPAVPDQPAAPEPPASLDEAVAALSRDLTGKIVPSMPADQRASFARKLLPPLKVVIASQLRIADAPNLDA